MLAFASEVAIEKYCAAYESKNTALFPITEDKIYICRTSNYRE